ncbi:MAG: hypothetical protein HUU50_01640 [Candidatus Brocadiae bacterium]|nr:hypothetical protein [Candidatus Brocadiia bacterium]
MDWAKKLEERLKNKELALKENKKNFHVYQESAVRLFEWIEKKVKAIQQITIYRYMVGETASATSQIKALKLKCLEKYLDFVPEGVNLDSSKGTIRLRHNSRSLAQYTYLHLIVNPDSMASYPENLVWVLNENSSEGFEKLPVFSDEVLERLIERVFLE